jgi:hypothetical protein
MSPVVIAWVGLCGLMAVLALSGGSILAMALIVWVGLLPATPLRTRVAKRWSHYLLIGLVLFVASCISTSYRRAQEQKAQTAATAAAARAERR